MSLECEGHGGVCEECGQFDFLPTECPECHRMLCQQHVRHHHTSALSETRCACGITGHNPNDLPEAEATERRAADTTVSSAPHCHTCGSELCVLCPCPLCQQNFCAEHRFHGHEEAADATRRRAPRVFTPASSRRAAGLVAEAISSGGADPQMTWLAQVCQPFTPASSLTLAPPTYRSRMMPCTVLLLVSVATTASSSAPDTHTAEPAPMWGVCSVSAAAEATVGQLVERLVASLQLWLITDEEQSGASDDARRTWAVRHTHPFKIEPDGTENPPFQLSALPLGAITRQVLTPQDVLVAFLNSGPCAGSTLREAVGSVVFAPLPHTTGSRDLRLHALATRLRLRAAAATRDRPAEAAPPRVDLDGPAESAEGCPASDSAPVQADTPATAAPADALPPWPFRTPPPLLNCAFANRKGEPFGRDAVMDKTCAVTVAVFVEDAALPGTVPPVCCVVSRAWSVGRVKAQIASAVERFSRGVTPESLRTYALWWMNGPADASGVLPCLVDAEAGAAAPLPGVALVADLKNGDVLLFGQPSSDGKKANAAVQAEVVRMRALKGKEQTALRMRMMQQCVTM